MDRRNFMKAMLAAAAAPAIVKADNLMNIWVPPTEIIKPYNGTIYIDNSHRDKWGYDDSLWLQLDPDARQIRDGKSPETAFASMEEACNAVPSILGINFQG